MTARKALCILAGSALALLHGCGYRAGFLIPADIGSVHVSVVRNETFWREAVKVDNLSPPALQTTSRPPFAMELDLTERLKNEIVRRTPLVLAGQEDADSILSTSITDVKPRVLVRDASDNVLAERVSITVGFVWKDRRSGRVLAQGSGLARPTDFLVPRGESLTTATRKSFDYVAEQIVERMQEEF